MFRLQIDISFLLEEYRTIQDPKGGYRGKRVWLRDKPKYYTSLLGEFADVIEAHLLGLTNSTAVEEPGIVREVALPVNEIAITKSAGICPSCKSSNTALMDNCLTCLDCAYSKCG
jgi:hypothetical protein